MIAPIDALTAAATWNSAMLVSELGDSDCEGLGDGFLAQPVNAVTSFAYVVVGLVVAAVAFGTRRRGERATSLVYAALLVGVGLGSVAFHGPQPAGSRLLHDLPILLTALLMADLDLRLLRPTLPRWALPLAALAATLLSIASPDAGIAATGVALAIVVVAEVMIYRRRLRPRSDRWQRRAYIAIIIVIAAGAASWLLGKTGSPACDADSPLQLHGLWHVLSALAFGAWWWLAIGPGQTAGGRDAAAAGDGRG